MAGNNRDDFGVDARDGMRQKRPCMNMLPTEDEWTKHQ